MTCPKCQSKRWWITTDAFNRAYRECADCLHAGDFIGEEVPKPPKRWKHGRGFRPFDALSDDNRPPYPLYSEGYPLMFDSYATEGEEWKAKAAAESRKKEARKKRDTASVEAFLKSLDKK